MQENRNFSVTISSGTLLKGLLLLLLFWLLYIVRDIVLVVLTAVVIASAIEPLTVWMKKFRISRLPAVVLIYAGIAGFCVGLFYFFLPTLLNETANFLATVPKVIDQVALWDPLASERLATSKQVVDGLRTGVDESISLVQGVSSFSAPVAEVSAPTAEGAVKYADLVTGFREAIASLSSSFVQTASQFFGGILSFILIVVLSFYLAVQEDGVAKFLRIVTPLKHERYVVGLWKRSQAKIGYWMQGQLLLALLVGILVYLGLVILGVENALFFAVLAAILEIIPLFGPIIAAIPAIGAAVATGGATAGLLVAGLYAIIQQFENHLFYPLVVKKIVGVSPILVILALIIGAKLAGFLGLLLSVPIAAAFTEYLDDVQRDKLSLESATKAS